MLSLKYVNNSGDGVGEGVHDSHGFPWQTGGFCMDTLPRISGRGLHRTGGSVRGFAPPVRVTGDTVGGPTSRGRPLAPYVRIG